VARFTAIVPVKRFTGAKRRLAEALGARARRKLVHAMLGDVLDAIGESSQVERLLVVTNEPRLPATGTPLTRVPDAPKRTSHSSAARRGIQRALRARAEGVVLLPGDCPLLDPAELDGALRRALPGQVGIVPDRHGTGTNALILHPPDAIAPAFGEGSRERHEQLAREAGHTPTIERLFSLALDIDAPADLAALRQFLDRDPALAPRTAKVLRDLKKL
jgi:2-phospho-L-lactate guanylyltransferase